LTHPPETFSGAVVVFFYPSFRNTLLNKFDLLPFVTADRDDEITHPFTLRVFLIFAYQALGNHAGDIRKILA
jgi:hypothetical protein